MAHFTKFWPSDLVEEVESLVREHVSIDHLLIVNIADSMFSGHHQVYQALQPADQQGTTPGHRVCKAVVSSRKTGRQNIDDTDLSSDDNDDDCRQTSKTTDTYIEEWNLYLKTHEAVPDGIEIVAWWGVCLAIFFPPDLKLTSGFSSCMVAATLRGSHLHTTTSLSWHPQSQARERSLQLVSQ
jgi:hypothetical protein